MPGSRTLRRAPRLGPLVSVLLLGMCTAWDGLRAEPEDTADAWLDRMVLAARNLNYDGTFIYKHGDKMESMRVIHRKDAQGERERLVALTGVAREVLRDRSRVKCILPDSRSVVVTKSRSGRFPGPGAFSRDNLWREHYSLAMAGLDRVAGRITQVLVINPNDEFRYGYRLGIDRETGLLLKSEVINRHGPMHEQIVFTSLSLPEQIPDKLLEPGISGDGFTWYSDASASDAANRAADMSWRVTWIPDGFAMSERESDFITKSPNPVEHMVYTDGLASLSVYIERIAPNGETLSGASKMGAVHAFGRVVDGFQVTVVGEVPQVTVENVARAVTRREP